MSSKKIVIIDYQLGNLFSVNQALVNIGLDTIISTDPADIETADALVLPGVGAFADAMQNLEQSGLIGPIKQAVADGKPFLGICLGLQLIFTESEEFGSSKGFNFVPGVVRKFPETDAQGDKLKVPQIAWNKIAKPAGADWNNTPLQNIEENEFFYFVHSFYVVPDDASVALTHTTYGDITYVSCIAKNNIFACQFHPEKSASEGLKIYKRWAELNNLLS